MKDKIAALLDQQVQCVLATQGGPELGLHLMAYAFSKDLDQIYIASHSHTRKVKNMRASSHVTLLWDNRTGNNTDHTQGLAISAFGDASELGGQSAIEVAKLLGERNTTLEKLLSANNTVVFAINIDRYQWVEGYSEVIIYRPVKSAG